MPCRQVNFDRVTNAAPLVPRDAATVMLVRDGVTGKGWVRKGVSLRTPAPLPPIAPASHRPNVVVIVTESVRADAMCSDPPPACQAPFLDAVVPEYERLWLVRNRPGGMPDSVARIRKLAAELRVMAG